jgi:hypothetical protein
MTRDLAIQGLAQAIDEPSGLLIALNGHCLTRENHTPNFAQKRDRRHVIVMQNPARRIFQHGGLL